MSGNGQLSGNGLTHRYWLLSPDERFRLALEADARGDVRERERLIGTCPMQTVHVSDPEYVDRVVQSRDLALTVALALGPAAAQLRMLRVSSDLVAALVTGGVEVADGADRGPLVSVLDASASEITADGAALWEAFAEVCQKRLLLEPEVVLAAHLGPYLEQLDIDAFRGAKPARSAVRGWRAAFERFLAA